MDTREIQELLPNLLVFTSQEGSEIDLEGIKAHLSTFQATTHLASAEKDGQHWWTLAASNSIIDSVREILPKFNAREIPCKK